MTTKVQAEKNHHNEYHDDNHYDHDDNNDNREYHGSLDEVSAFGPARKAQEQGQDQEVEADHEVEAEQEQVGKSMLFKYTTKI